MATAGTAGATCPSRGAGAGILENWESGKLRELGWGLLGDGTGGGGGDLGIWKTGILGNRGCYRRAAGVGELQRGTAADNAGRTSGCDGEAFGKQFSFMFLFENCFLRRYLAVTPGVGHRSDVADCHSQFACDLIKILLRTYPVDASEI